MKKKPLYLVLAALLMVTAACGGNNGKEGDVSDGDNSNSQNSEEPDSLVDVPTSEVTLFPEQNTPAGASQFTTDFSKAIISFDEVLSGGPPKDGIPAVDDPKFISIGEADAWLEDVEPVVVVTYNGETRAYPIQILMWHEIVNDRFGDEPVSVTFCPLCNTGIVFSGKLDEYNFDFGTTGQLRYSNLIMYDRQTETWWQQATGQAIVGELTGKQLSFIPALMVSWEQFKESFPDSKVLSKDTGYTRRYGVNPYVGYDSINNSPFLYLGPEIPGVLPATARVLTLDIDGDATAYPYTLMQKVGVVNDTVGGQEVVIFWQPGVASALGRSQIAEGQDVGAVAAFSRNLDGQTLNFVYKDGEILDEQTQSVWNVLGEAVSGDLAGSTLEQVTSINHFWFSWAAFRPDTRIYQVE